MDLSYSEYTYKSIVGTANVPVGVINAPGTDGPSTGVMKL